MKKSVLKLEINKYVYILISFVIIFLSFLAFMSIEAILQVSLSLVGENNTQIHISTYEERYAELEQEEAVPAGGFGQAGDTSNLKHSTVVIGHKEDQMSNLIYTQLENLKEDYFAVESFEELSQADIGDTDIYIVSDENISKSQILQLGELSQQGKTVVFMNSLRTEDFQDSEIGTMLGVSRYIGQTQVEGYRISKDLSFFHMKEIQDLEIQMEEVELVSQTKKYMYGLLADEEIENEELPPLMWRYSNGSGQIYVCQGDIFISPISYSFITEIYGELSDTYIYPIVNAYMFMVEGMPYTTNTESEFLRRLYERDAISLQNSILFPQFTSSENRYGIKITWYSPEYDEVLESENKDIEYYLNQMEIRGSELAKKQGEALVSDRELKNQAVIWEPYFRYYDEQQGMIQLPMMIKADTFEEELVNMEAMATASGFMSMYVDIEDFLVETSNNWVEFSLDYENSLGLHVEYYPWLDRVTASEAAKRVVSFLTIEPEYEYHENKVILDIKKFIDEAYFIMNTKETIKEAVDAEVTNIGDNMYLIEAKSQQVEILFEEENS